MATTKWALDATHSELGFKIKHLMISNVSGRFNSFDVNAETANDEFTDAAITATIDVASIFTNNEQRDGHLRTGDFFEIEKYPNITFKSTSVKKDGDDLEVSGDLTMKDVTKAITIKVEFAGITKDLYGNTKAGFSFAGKLNRKDWGINFNAALETGGVMLGEEVKFDGEIQLIKQG
ncbi:MAG: polyisoprenoid-binding protein [Chitinophagaceae bacterium]|nr:MAG: polyisoprenoid-binding protein [Chitinophagaceae bacterium]